MKTTEIKCDTCESDLKYTGYASEYYLTLMPTPKGHKGGAVMGMNLGPAIKQEMHFCGLKCLTTKFNA